MPKVLQIKSQCKCKASGMDEEFWSDLLFGLACDRLGRPAVIRLLAGAVKETLPAQPAPEAS